MGYLGDGAQDMEPVDAACGNLGPLASLAAAELPGCDDLILRQQLGFALREFCRETDACTASVHLRWEDGIDAPNGRRFRFASPHPGMDVWTVLGVFDGGVPVLYRLTGTFCASGAEVSVVGHPHGSRGLEIRVSLCPKPGGEGCPRAFLDRYAEAIVAGAMYHMLSMSGRAWSDSQRAAQYMAKYHDAISEAAYRRTCGPAASDGAASAIPTGMGVFL